MPRFNIHLHQQNVEANGDLNMRSLNMYAEQGVEYTGRDELVVDDKNNNGHFAEKLSKHLHRDIVENNKSQNDKFQIHTAHELGSKTRTNEQTMEKNLNDTRLNDTSTSGETTKTAPINFSVDSILSNTHVRAADTDNVNRKSSVSVVKSSDDYSRIYRPLPMRYVSNPSIFQGFAVNASLQMHRQMKYPISNYHCSQLSAISSPITQSYGVDRFLLPSPVAVTVPFAHFQNVHHRSELMVDPTNPKITSIPPPNASTMAGNANLGQQSKRKRSWSRAVFSQLQRKGLEIQFQIQKYITKPDRRKLAARLGLTDAQVKVWFQNRRMKWRHSKLDAKQDKNRTAQSENQDEDEEQDCVSGSASESCSSGDENEIDIEAE